MDKHILMLSSRKCLGELSSFFYNQALFLTYHRDFLNRKQIVKSTLPAKKQFQERGWGKLNCPRPVVSA